MSPHSWNVGTTQDHHHQAYLLSEWKYWLSLSEKDSTNNLHHLYYAESIRIPQLLIKPNKKSFERKTSSWYEDPLLFMESSNLDGTCIQKRREPTLTCQSLKLPVTQINQLNEFTLEHYSNKKYDLDMNANRRVYKIKLHAILRLPMSYGSVSQIQN